MKIYNTLSRQVEDFRPLSEGKIKMYACGLTPYDYSHLGHAMQGIIFDVIRRYFELKGFEVTYVRNYTDVDDKIINAAKEIGIDPLVHSKRMIDAAEKDFKDLGLHNATFTPLVTQSITEIINFIKLIIDKDFGYITSEGNVYFRVAKFNEYGKLTNQDVTKLIHGTRKDIEQDKENPLDFALWKSSKPKEIYWNSPWGKGRPGWHIECSAMSKKYLGESFDIHGGGKDLVFPHHENEIAQSESVHNKKFAKYWIHNGMMNLNGEKMSKSTKNYLLIKDALSEYHSETIKYVGLTNHYRSDQEYNSKRFHDAQSRIYYYYKTLKSIGYLPTTEIKINNKNRLTDAFFKAMDNDFNSVEVFALLDTEMKKVNENVLKNNLDLIELLFIVAKVFGILNKKPDEILMEIEDLEIKSYGITREYIEDMVTKRLNYKQSNKYNLADEVREDLLKKGVLLMDSGDETKWEPAFK